MPFFLSCYLAVVIFVVYMTLLFNRSIDATGFSTVKLIIAICNIIIVIFSLIYVTYAMQASFGLRKYEFGILNLMGVSDRKIRQSIRCEIIYIGSSAIILGTISGITLSKVAFRALASALCISGATFMIDPKSILLSVALFMVMFLTIARFNARKITKTKPLDLINSQRTPEKVLYNPTLGFIGIVAPIILILMFLIKNINLSVLIICIPLVEFLFFRYGILYLANLISRKWANLNYRFLYVLSRLKFNIATNWKLMLISSILQTSILVFVGFAFSAFVQDSTIADNRYAADLCIIVSDKPDMHLKKETLDQIDLLSESKVIHHGTIPVIFAVDAMNNSVIGVISLASYDNVSKALIVDANSILVLSINQQSSQSDSEAIEFLIGGNQCLLNVDTIYDPSFALNDIVSRYLVISDDEYTKYEQLYSDHQRRILTYCFDDWHENIVLTDQIIGLITKSNPHYNTNNIASKWSWYQSFHQFSAQLSFLAIFVGGQHLFVQAAQ